jgi:transcriptional regulator with XRE-family HTH domain
MEDLLYIEIGKLIKKARNLKEWTQVELGEKVGMSRVSITNIEQGNQRPSIYTLYIIAEELGVNPVSLLPDPTQLKKESKLFAAPEEFKGLVTLKDYEAILKVIKGEE